MTVLLSYVPESNVSKVLISTSELFTKFNGEDEVRIEHKHSTIDELASRKKKLRDSNV